MLLLALAIAAASQSTPATDFTRADAALNAQYRATLAQARRLDGGGRPGDRGPTYAAALVAAQRAWVAFRDAECRIEGYQFRGGSAEGLAHRQCMIRLTRVRTADLATLRSSLTPL